jgi:hypothetical protein
LRHAFLFIVKMMIIYAYKNHLASDQRVVTFISFLFVIRSDQCF